MKNRRISAVDDPRPYGVFLWEGPSGKYLADDEGNFLNIPARDKYDMEAMRRLADAAHALGFGDGKAVFHQGGRRVTDAEWDLMGERLEQGLTADPAEEYADYVQNKRIQEQHGGS